MERNSNLIVTGASGLVGYHLLHFFVQQGFENIFALYQTNPILLSGCIPVQCDICDLQAVQKLKSLRPQLIVHCAALTGIADCEKNPKRAHAINVEGSRNIALLASETASKLVYLSTDAVFDGKKPGYKEKDLAKPLHFYGKSKLLGERVCSKINPKALIVRMNIFGRNPQKGRKSFLDSILEALEQRKEYFAFKDAFFAPLYIVDFVKYLYDLLSVDAEGIFHVVASESLTKYHFAQLVAEVYGFDKRLIVPSSIESLGMVREKDLSLSNEKFLREIGKVKTESIENMLMNSVFKGKEKICQS